jgi:TonB family protein
LATKKQLGFRSLPVWGYSAVGGHDVWSLRVDLRSGAFAVLASAALHTAAAAAAWIACRATATPPAVPVEVEFLYRSPPTPSPPPIVPEEKPRASGGLGHEDLRPARRPNTIPGRALRGPARVWVPPPPAPVAEQVVEPRPDESLLTESVAAEVPREDLELPEGELIFAEPEGGGEGEELGEPSLSRGDLRRLVQERINFVARLVGSAAARRARASGVAVAQIRVDRRGYVREVYLVRSTGTRALDREIVPILHLAEPYPYWHGLLKVMVPYSLLRGMATANGPSALGPE